MAYTLSSKCAQKKISVNGQFYFNLSSKTCSHVFLEHSVEWCGYPIMKKKLRICLFVLTKSTNVTDGQTDTHTEMDRQRMAA